MAARSCVFVSLFSALSAAEFALTPQLFQVDGGSAVNNAKLTWSAVDSATNYIVSRTNSSASSTVANVTGDSYDDYDLAVDTPVSYQIIAYSQGTQLDSSNTVQVIPYTPTATYSTYKNTEVSSLNLRSGIEVNSTYYLFQQGTDSSGYPSIVAQTSTDGYNFGTNSTVLGSETICASTNGTCKLERTVFFYNPSTDYFVMWAHYENAEDYSLGEVACAHGAAGQNWTFDGAYQPLGHDSRDMTVFTDDDGSAYLVSATNTNTDMNIYQLTSNWTAVDSLLTTVLKSQYREAPAVVKDNGTYFLFTSRAAGWYPSAPEYISSSAMEGPWSESRYIGNTATFCTQSGSVDEANSSYVMMGDRWSANWSPAQPPNRELALPLSFSGTGYASYHYYSVVKASDEGGIYGVQSGKILSQGKEATSSGGSNITLATDGTQDDPNLYFMPDTVPFWLQIDLEDSYAITQVDLTTRMVQGSETYYQFNITASIDGSSYTLLADASNNTDVGFKSVLTSNTEEYRYVRINVDKVMNTHNSNEADWAAGVHELIVYGK
ncbi:hypothetical protein Plec18167_006107 [Paecilomyces lecythidis]|uniref:F5/8 type C domain-containing protein n=1 Tax=Paecilomyces lecythidis TaxID=3004212 RepID=A0ABR3XDY7_9EURO